MVQKCCWFIKLRKACILIAVIDFIINLAVLNLSGQEFIAHIEQAVAICHCIGCTFLLGGALIRSTILLMFFLITSLTNCIIMIVYCIVLLVRQERYHEIIVPISALYICCDVYFWVIVYSFYVQMISWSELSYPFIQGLIISILFEFIAKLSIVYSVNSNEIVVSLGKSDFQYDWTV